MQFGIFTIGDVTPDPITGKAPSEAQRIQSMTKYALKAEEVGLDVFATGEHHNPPFVPSSPTTHLAYIAALWPDRKSSWRGRPGALIHLALLVVGLAVVVPAAGPALTVPVIVYGVVLALMAVLAQANRIVLGISSLRPESTIHSSGFFDDVTRLRGMSRAWA